MQDTTITPTQRQVKEIPTRVVRAAAVQMSPELYSREARSKRSFRSTTR